MTKAFLTALACLALTACGTYRSDRAISGGLIGAGTGAIAGPIGILAGGAIGAGTGAFTSPDFINLGQPFWRKDRQITVDPGGQYAPAKGTLAVDAYGYARVSFTNNCNVYFDAMGTRQSTTGPCANDQIGDAERQVTEYRRGATPTLSPVSSGLDINKLRSDCEAAAERAWNLRGGDARSSSVRGDDRTGYEIGFTAGVRVGTCTISPAGVVTGVR